MVLWVLSSAELGLRPAERGTKRGCEKEASASRQEAGRARSQDGDDPRGPVSTPFGLRGMAQRVRILHRRGVARAEALRRVARSPRCRRAGALDRADGATTR